MTQATSDTTTDTENPGGDGPLRYDPRAIEARWMRRWLDRGAFEAEVDGSRPAYTIVIPPPNVTGALHMGHALNGSVQDALIRFKRMQGYNALWLPGTDHAGIATQNVVEKELRKEGRTRHDLGRERFVERVWQWKEQYGATIITQYQRLGASLDYRRERFTMDDAYARAVLHAFVRLFEKGYIYRDNYLVNWCGRCHTAISDLEVRQADADDEMFQVDYPLAGGGGHITVATVRPETIVADVAVAVHPEDDRYRDMVGQHVRVPMTDRTVAIIADDYVDREFGTGALKITPGHDPNDFEIGDRHDLPRLSAINPDLSMSALAGEFAGMNVAEARKAMARKLEELGLLRSRENYRHSVPHCDRCGTRIEPLISLQWFCNMGELAKPAIAAVEQGEVRFVPEGARNIFSTWMDNLKPWCLSRQLWWGHQLPVWYCRGEDEHVHVSLDGPDGPCPDCGAADWRRDEDVLDTWFSSGLWDFATLGWPEQTAELEYFHPTAVLVTAREIINLWVARMMMMSYEFIGEKPFSDVYIHSVIQAPDGRRMSKSLGTGIDPLDLIDEFGADATRYGLLNMSSTQDVRFNKGKIQEGRDLANKLWNASRLLVMFGDRDVVDEPLLLEHMTHVEDRWIWSRLHRAVVELTSLLEDYDFALYTKTLYQFIWSELCDWYLESVKDRLRSEDAPTRQVATRMLAMVLDQTLRLVHPVMPHITEEIAEQVWGESEDPDRMVINAHWPEAAFEDELSDDFARAEHEYGEVQEAVSRLRSLRQSAGVRPAEAVRAQLSAAEGDADVDGFRRLVGTLANVEWTDAGDSPIELFLGPHPAVVYGLDAAVLRERLSADLTAARGELERAQRKLGDERFTARAPEELVEVERTKARRFAAQVDQLEQVLAQLG